MGISESDLAGLLTETAARHHDAYRAADGYDPEWPAWYAQYLAVRLDDQVDERKTPSELAELLREADQQFNTEGLPFEEWPIFYARYFLARW